MVALRFPGIPPTLLHTLSSLLETPNPFSDYESVEVLSHSAGLVFSLDDGKRGYSFCRNIWGVENDVEIFQCFLQDPIQTLYMPVVYEVANVSAIETLLANYVGIVGADVASKIDWISYKPADKTLLILRLPREAVAALYAKQGGTLTTRVRGSAGSLRQIATLRPIVPEDAGDHEVVHRAFAIQYGRDAYEQAQAAHVSVLREVIAKPDLGISLGPLAVWTP